MLLQQISSIYENAAKFEVTRQALGHHDAIDPLTQLHRDWKELVKDEEDIDSRELFFKVWRICWDVTSCLVPFDSPDLDLRTRVNQIRESAKFYPSMSRQMDELQAHISFLIKHPINPKGELVFEIIKGLTNGGKIIGLVSRMSRTNTPGWQEDFANIFATQAKHCVLLKTRRDLLENVMDVIVLPGSGRNCPFVADLFGLYRSRQLIIVQYSSERKYQPKMLELPAATLSAESSRGRSQVKEEESDVDSQLEDWITNEEWELARLHAQGAAYSTGMGGHQFLVLARLVLLESGAAVYLQDDRKVLEVSSLTSGESMLDESSKQLPRKNPKHLRSGDVIGLRTSGSGDYLQVVADQLLKKDGKERLRDSCTDWKTDLENVLATHGADKVAALLLERGTTVSFPGYIWHWTKDDVIRPQKKESFLSLIQVISQLGGLSKIGDLNKYTNDKWRQMKDLIKYHLKAGMEIRRALLSHLGDLLESSPSLNHDEVVLALPEVDAGEITLFKVAAVDKDPTEVPYTRINVVVD